MITLFLCYELYVMQKITYYQSPNYERKDDIYLLNMPSEKSPCDLLSKWRIETEAAIARNGTARGRV